MSDAMMIFEGACPHCESSELVNHKVECHPDQVEMWDGASLVVETNENMAADYGQTLAYDWISSRLAIYTCQCAECGAAHHLEQNQYGDWLS